MGVACFSTICSLASIGMSAAASPGVLMQNASNNSAEHAAVNVLADVETLPPAKDLALSAMLFSMTFLSVFQFYFIFNEKMAVRYFAWDLLLNTFKIFLALTLYTTLAKW